MHQRQGYVSRTLDEELNLSWKKSRDLTFYQYQKEMSILHEKWLQGSLFKWGLALTKLNG